MAEKPDFGKVWAQNSPLPEYKFSDSDYLEGWNFVGSIPPARGMFDALQRQTDEKLRYLDEHGDEAIAAAIAAHNTAADAHENRFSQYLPLSGGQMTGAINLPKIGYTIKTTDNTGAIALTGGASGADGANIILFGEETQNAEILQKGAFSIGAIKNGRGYILLGRPDGDLFWSAIGGVLKPIKSMAFPSSTSVVITKNTEYTAPANGWIWAQAVTTSSNPILETEITVNNVIRAGIPFHHGSRLFVPVKKGDVIIAKTVIYSGAIAYEEYRFYYAEGEV